VGPVGEPETLRADLHSHSTASDGTCPPAEVMRRARAAGLDVIALTDHDTVAGHEEARRALPRGLTLLPGMELSCRLEGHSVHLLGYLFDPAHDELAAELARIRESREQRARATVARLAELGAPVTWEQVSALAGNGVVGRPHIARAMVAAGVIASPEQAFGPDWIGAGGRAHVTRYALDPARAVALIRDAGGVTVLAHPRVAERGWTVPDDRIADLAAAGLSGIEVRHPDHDPAQRAELQALADRLGLVASGGSDDHGELTGYRIGSDTIAPDAYERLVSQATGATPVSGR
jgi:3',5'-nucleoside bisphosphate phosphatase